MQHCNLDNLDTFAKLPMHWKRIRLCLQQFAVMFYGVHANVRRDCCQCVIVIIVDVDDGVGVVACNMRIEFVLVSLLSGICALFCCSLYPTS